MPLTWEAFQTALNGASNAAAALDALIVSSMPDVQETLDMIGAGEAGLLLAGVPRAEPSKRRATLAASLEIVDRYLDAYLPLAKSRTRDGSDTDPSVEYNDVAQAALFAALMDAELGGDAERQRSRAVLAVRAGQANFATRGHQLTKSAHREEHRASNLVAAGVFRLILNEMKPRRSRIRFGRRRQE